MFGGNKRKSAAMDTLVGSNTRIVGDVHFEGGLHVDGEIEGNVHAGEAHSALSLSERGRVVGEVHVSDVMLNGLVEGDVHVTGNLELGARARVEGDVYYNSIRMEAGATVNGKLVHKPVNNEPLQLRHDNGETGEAAESDEEAAKSGE
ncbi:MAG: polymer-forming cytoskeletal protein [Gammaproteobacteria bacterium]|nr:polymer-forming cytoskeletal protein [Gammaproteobacteria bacterium]